MISNYFFSVHTSPPALNLSQFKVFSSELNLCIRWPKYWSFSFSNSPSNENSELISFRLAGFISLQSRDSQVFSSTTLKASVLQCSALFQVQNSQPYRLLEKNIVLTRQTFVGKVMSLLFNLISRLVIAFLPRSKSFNFLAEVTISSDFGAQENSLSLFPFFPHLFVMKWWDQMPWC